MPRGRKYPQELIDRGVRLVFESGRPIAQVAADLGMHPEALRKRVRQAEIDPVDATVSPARSTRRSRGCGVRTSSCAARMRS